MPAAFAGEPLDLRGLLIQRGPVIPLRDAHQPIATSRSLGPAVVTVPRSGGGAVASGRPVPASARRIRVLRTMRPPSSDPAVSASASSASTSRSPAPPSVSVGIWPVSGTDVAAQDARSSAGCSPNRSRRASARCVQGRCDRSSRFTAAVVRGPYSPSSGPRPHPGAPQPHLHPTHRERASKPVPGRRPGDTVGAQAGRGLESQQRGLGTRAEQPIERPGRSRRRSTRCSVRTRCASLLCVPKRRRGRRCGVSQPAGCNAALRRSRRTCPYPRAGPGHHNGPQSDPQTGPPICPFHRGLLSSN